MRAELWVIALALSAFVGALVYIFACLGPEKKVSKE